MKIHDYNGSGQWSVDEVVRRYRSLAEQFGVETVRDLRPRIHETGGEKWIYPIMEDVIAGIKAGDSACAQIGIEFIVEDQSFPFGAILKANAARALRQFDYLNAEQIEQLRKRIVGMFETGEVPREFQAYARLLRKIGVGEHWNRIAAAEPNNHHAKNAMSYFLRHCEPTRE